ncbi:MAG: isoamylase early set domain-containing protein [Proteobacteria bacterium]|nr:isoamylase early set domain-containing protein [Pseudomonadota bacterium]
MVRTSEKKPKVKKVEFSLSAPQVQSVFVAGDFTEWNPSSHPLKQDKKGVWRIFLRLNPGQYEYRFFVDGEWQNDPNCCSFRENPFGTSNCLKIVE